jgi:hypothetical protein
MELTSSLEKLEAPSISKSKMGFLTIKSNSELRQSSHLQTNLKVPCITIFKPKKGQLTVSTPKSDVITPPNEANQLTQEYLEERIVNHGKNYDIIKPRMNIILNKEFDKIKAQQGDFEPLVGTEAHRRWTVFITFIDFS